MTLNLHLTVPFHEKGLIVPIKAIAWPTDRAHRVSINSFGIGGANAHVSPLIETFFDLIKTYAHVMTSSGDHRRTIKSRKRGQRYCD